LDRLEGDPAMAKVSSSLLRIRSLTRDGVPLAEIRTSAPLVGFRNDLPEIDVRLRELTPAIVAEVRRIGMRVTGVHYDYARIVGLCEPALLDEIAAIPQVATIHPNYRPRAWTGSVTSQGDASIHADNARADFGVDGTGVQVGILTNSFHATASVGGSVTGTGCSRTLTGSLPQSTGDLPAAVTILDNCDSGASCSAVDDEGAAMAEIVHDLAPGAEILFHSAFNSEADFAQGITELAACGADIIVDDVLWFAEPMFQDGIIAQALESAVAGGVSYFSAAGNNGARSVDEIYLDANPGTDDEAFPTSGADLHDFGGNNRFGEITIPDGCGVSLVLQWNEPYSGTLGDGSARDLDLYLCSSDSLASSQGSLVACNFTGALAVGDDGQGCGADPPSFGDPFEILSYTNTSGSPVSAYVAVEHFCGTQAGTRFRVIASGVGCGLTDPGYSFEGPGIFDKSPIYGHPAAAGGLAVGSVFYGEIDTGGNEELPMGLIDVKPSSSVGGDLPFYFDGSGNPLPSAPVIRFKPDIVAPEGTNTTFFGVDSAFDPDSFPNFFGTSASTTHAAAVAALALEADPTLTPQGVRDILTLTALDIEAAGVDPLSGYGLIQADEAVLVADCGSFAPGETTGLVLDKATPGSVLVNLSWQPTTGAVTYNLYRGEQADLSDLSCLSQGIAGTTASDTAVPVGQYYYLVTATNCAGESTLGGAGRTNPDPCP
ncbi:MAG: S8 family serine peptidase, partial [Acidobacteriota bacterium]|nr:S8 family serine peptidase [Acidobacteriota bacterium]